MLFRKTKADDKPQGRASGLLSVIVEDTHILGTLISDGNIDFNGTIDGNIRCHNLTVRKNARIKGDITADALHVHGKINGLIRAKQVNLYKDCHVEGVIMHEGLTIEDGAFMDGKCKRTDKPVHDTDELLDLEDTAQATTIRLIS
jgi:cytoskeletal protein CcmA (bactofilin family)